MYKGRAILTWARPWRDAGRPLLISYQNLIQQISTEVDFFNSFPVRLTKVKYAFVVDFVGVKINTFDIIPLSFGQFSAIRSIDIVSAFICAYLLILRDLIRGLQQLLTSTEQLSGLSMSMQQVLMERVTEASSLSVFWCWLMAYRHWEIRLLLFVQCQTVFRQEIQIVQTWIGFFSSTTLSNPCATIYLASQFNIS